MRPNHTFGCLVLACVLSTTAYCQRIENVNATVTGEKVIISYNITGALEGQKFKVLLYSSIDNFTTPLTHVTGDVGPTNELSAGIYKRIEWDAKNEVKDFSGEVSFEIRGEVIAAPYTITGPSYGNSFKRGKNVNIVWKGGKTGEAVILELLKGGQPVSQIGHVQNSGTHAWRIPKETGKGSDYQIRLTADGKTITGGNFKIKKRTSFFVKMLPVLAAGGAAYYFLGGPKPDDELPKPPLPTGGQ